MLSFLLLQSEVLANEVITIYRSKRQKAER